MKNILIIGGTGNFGLRIAKGLCDLQNTNIYISSRTITKANVICNSLGHQYIPIELDTDSLHLEDQLQHLKLDLIINTAGPFQDQTYRLPMLTAACKAHYIDLADSRHYVSEFSGRNNYYFTQSETIAISGASTLPAISSAIIDLYHSKFRQLDSIKICIAPGQKTERGLATLESILNYCGNEIKLLQHSKWTSVKAITTLDAIKIKGFENRLGLICDVPDLDLFREIYNPKHELTFQVAFELNIVSRILSIIGYLHSLKIIKHPNKLAKIMLKCAPLLDKFGSDVGALQVKLSGIGYDASYLRYTHELIARDGRGPEIPSIPAILLARKILTNSINLKPGAYTATSLLNYQELQSEFDKLNISTNFSQD